MAIQEAEKEAAKLEREASQRLAQLEKKKQMKEQQRCVTVEMHNTSKTNC